MAVKVIGIALPLLPLDLEKVLVTRSYEGEETGGRSVELSRNEWIEDQAGLQGEAMVGEGSYQKGKREGWWGVAIHVVD